MLSILVNLTAKIVSIREKIRYHESPYCLGHNCLVGDKFQQWSINKSYLKMHHGFLRGSALKRAALGQARSRIRNFLTQCKNIRTRINIVHSCFLTSSSMMKLGILILLFLSIHYFDSCNCDPLNHQLLKRKRPKQTLANFLFHHLSAKFRRQGSRRVKRKPLRLQVRLTLD